MWKSFGGAPPRGPGWNLQVGMCPAARESNRRPSASGAAPPARAHCSNYKNRSTKYQG